MIPLLQFKSRNDPSCCRGYHLFEDLSYDFKDRFFGSIPEPISADSLDLTFLGHRPHISIPILG
jgi:hypothetical protein